MTLNAFLLHMLVCVTCVWPGIAYHYYPWYHQGGLFNSFHSRPQTRNPMTICSLQRKSDVLRLLPGRFLSQEALEDIVPEPKILTRQHRPTFKSVRRVVVASFASNSPFKTGKVSYINDGLCGCCLTEIAYEVIDSVTDFDGRNHTIINFNNNYQFIPTGRCSNEDAPCGGGGRARCKQVTRAHWSLVWTPRIGAQLVAHEVPSHCQCLNIGSSTNQSTVG